jgi:hypothetical protein
MTVRQLLRGLPPALNVPALRGISGLRVLESVLLHDAKPEPDSTGQSRYVCLCPLGRRAMGGDPVVFSVLAGHHLGGAEALAPRITDLSSDLVRAGGAPLVEP